VVLEVEKDRVVSFGLFCLLAYSMFIIGARHVCQCVVGGSPKHRCESGGVMSTVDEAVKEGTGVFVNFLW